MTPIRWPSSQYISPQSGALLKRNGLGYLDLSGNCLSRLRQCPHREGRQAQPPSVHPPAQVALRAPGHRRGSRPPRRIPAICGGSRSWPRRAEVSLGHAHNVVKRLERPRLGRARERQRIYLVQAGRPARRLGRRLHLSPQSHGSRTSRRSESPASSSGDIARAAQRSGSPLSPSRCTRARRSWRPNVRFPPSTATSRAIRSRSRRRSGFGPGEDEGNVHLHDAVRLRASFTRPITKSGVLVVCLPQLVRRSLSLRAPGPGAGRPSAARGHGLLSVSHAGRRRGELAMAKKKVAKKSAAEEG